MCPSKWEHSLQMLSTFLKVQIKKYWYKKGFVLFWGQRQIARGESGKQHLGAKQLEFPSYFKGFMGTVWISWKTQEAGRTDGRGLAPTSVWKIISKNKCGEEQNKCLKENLQEWVWRGTKQKISVCRLGDPGWLTRRGRNQHRRQIKGDWRI